MFRHITTAAEAERVHKTDQLSKKVCNEVSLRENWVAKFREIIRLSNGCRKSNVTCVARYLCHCVSYTECRKLDVDCCSGTSMYGPAYSVLHIVKGFITFISHLISPVYGSGVLWDLD